MALASGAGLAVHLLLNPFVDEEQFPREFSCLIPAGKKSLAP